MDRLFDSVAFGRELRERVDALLPMTWREHCEDAGVSKATFSRAMNGEPNLSYENYLRLKLWLNRTKKRLKAA